MLQGLLVAEDEDGDHDEQLERSNHCLDPASIHSLAVTIPMSLAMLEGISARLSYDVVDS